MHIRPILNVSRRWRLNTSRSSALSFGVFEVGLGRTADSTNILTPVVSIITRIDFDHENFLGHSLREIAGEKAGIIKAAVPVVVAEQRAEAAEVIQDRAKELLSPVIETARSFRIENESMQDGLARARITEVASGWSDRTGAEPRRAASSCKMRSMPWRRRGCCRQRGSAFPTNRSRGGLRQRVGPDESRKSSRVRMFISTGHTIRRQHGS